MTTSPAATLLLLQLMDSSFPVGTFAHSYGLEQSVRDRHVSDADGVEAFVATILEMQVATADARALVRAYAATEDGDFAGVSAADHDLHVTKATLELRAASTSTGRRLLQEVVAHPEVSTPVIEAYLEAIERDEVPGTHAVALGVVGASLGVGVGDLVGALLFSTANTLHQAAMRLLPVSHRDAQAALHHHRSEITRLAEHAVSSSDERYASFAPLQEIASMRHEGAPVRFFTS